MPPVYFKNYYCKTFINVRSKNIIILYIFLFLAVVFKKDNIMNEIHDRIQRVFKSGNGYARLQ